MELVPVSYSWQGFAELWSIYESSFPPDERRALERQREVFSESSYRLLAAVTGKKAEGFISYWELPEFDFIEHFAVHEGSRGRGLGGRILSAFLEGRGTVVMEVERPVSGLQARRISFYEKAGFRMNAFDYIQPPYGPGKKPVHMLLMSWPGPLSADELSRMRKVIHRKVYGLDEPLL